MRTNYSYLIFCSFLLITMSIASCSRTVKSPEAPQESGFLGDYEGFEEDPEGRFSLLYINENADFSKYTNFYVETVTAFVPEGSDLEKVKPEKIQNVVDYIKETITTDFSQTWTLVDTPGENTMAIRFAFTQLSTGNRVGDTVTTYAPPARAFSELKKLATGKHAFVGQIAHEAEILDSATGERLVATLGVRSGGKTFKNATDKERDIKAAVDVWVDRAYNGMVELKEGKMQ